MTRTSLTACALLLALCGSASAADNAALKKCMDSANTTVDMVNCNAKEAKVQDERLNRAYKTALAAQEGARKQQLQAPWNPQRTAYFDQFGCTTEFFGLFKTQKVKTKVHRISAQNKVQHLRLDPTSGSLTWHAVYTIKMNVVHMSL